MTEEWFRKRPTKVRAFRIGYARFYPDWLHDAITANDVRTYANPLTGGWKEPFNSADVRTLHGIVHAAHGDWIIKGEAGDLWPATPKCSRPVTNPSPQWTASGCMGEGYFCSAIFLMLSLARLDPADEPSQ